ncbi:hypothetical protein [Pseudocnuella soli]|uniref:hypothetical protein n=1 Tax=Pseudocnuella soli TaxID=2502779 RepID=UPI001053FA26|nr:hypothetical protein [Pseudocnuella soli]
MTFAAGKIWAGRRLYKYQLCLISPELSCCNKKKFRLAQLSHRPNFLRPGVHAILTFGKSHRYKRLLTSVR